MASKDILEKLCQFIDENHSGEEKSIFIDTINDFCVEEDISFHYEYDEDIDKSDTDFLDDIDPEDEKE